WNPLSGWHSFRDPLALSPSSKNPCALCLLGSWPRLPHRSAHRRGAGPLVSAGSVAQRRWPAADPGIGQWRRSRTHPARSNRAAVAQAPRTVLGDRTAASLFTSNLKGGIVTRPLLAVYGLKWNPFTPDIPNDAL